MDKKRFLEYFIKYIKNCHYYLKNYKKILDIYEDKISKMYIKEYIRNRSIYPLYYFRLLDYKNNSELLKIKKLVKFKNNCFIINGLKFNFPSSHRYIKTQYHDIVFPEVFLHHVGLKYFENDILNKIKNGNIIDCGAFIGDSSIILSKYTNYKVFAFEPDRSIFKYLIKNIKENNLKNKVIPLNYGVGDKEEILNFGEDELKITTIDNIVKKENIGRVSLIKMDIEGYELKALKGARETIQKYKPVLIISAYHRREDILEIPYYLKDLVPEYKFRFLNLRKSHPIFEKVIIAYSK